MIGCNSCLASHHPLGCFLAELHQPIQVQLLHARLQHLVPVLPLLGGQPLPGGEARESMGGEWGWQAQRADVHSFSQAGGGRPVTAPHMPAVLTACVQPTPARPLACSASSRRAGRSARGARPLQPSRCCLWPFSMVRPQRGHSPSTTNRPSSRPNRSSAAEQADTGAGTESRRACQGGHGGRCGRERRACVVCLPYVHACPCPPTHPPVSGLTLGCSAASCTRHVGQSLGQRRIRPPPWSRQATKMRLVRCGPPVPPLRACAAPTPTTTTTPPPPNAQAHLQPPAAPRGMLLCWLSAARRTPRCIAPSAGVLRYRRCVRFQAPAGSGRWVQVRAQATLTLANGLANGTQSHTSACSCMCACEAAAAAAAPAASAVAAGQQARGQPLQPVAEPVLACPPCTPPPPRPIHPLGARSWRPASCAVLTASSCCVVLWCCPSLRA